MANTAGMGLTEPRQIDWDNYNPGSRYVPPPPAKDAGGKTIVYSGQLPKDVIEEQDDEGYRRYLLDPITLVKNGGTVDGTTIRFTRVSVKPFEKNGKPVNASSAGNVLRSAGVPAKPQKTAEYDNAMKAARGRIVQFAIDWEARNKDTGEKVSGYDNFPDDTDRPGQKKSILRAGDAYKTKEGATAIVQSEVLFANPRVRYFVDGSRK